MRQTTLHDLYLDELKELYSAEHQIFGILPKLAQAASNPLLSKAISDHVRETERQVGRLEELFKVLGVSPYGRTCSVMKRLLDDGRETMRGDTDPTVKDAAIIAMMKCVEHFEIAGYECARTFARLLGYEQATRSLQKSLDEEKAADGKLTRLAETVILCEVAFARQ